MKDRQFQEASAFLAQSEEFYHAFERLSGAWVLGTPAIVCLAFSAELGLKSLHLIDHGKYPKSNQAHGLKFLFDGLLSETKSVIEEVGIPSYPKYDPPKTFDDYLREHAEIFKEWRYACEPSKALSTVGETVLVANVSFLKAVVLKVQWLAQRQIQNASSGSQDRFVVGATLPRRLIIK